ncbi:hypothetical protein PAMA_015217 [Pampus argenteus]
MESVLKVKKSLRTPVRKLTGYVTRVKERTLCAKRRNRRSRGVGGRGGFNRLRKTPPPQTAYAKDASVIRSYQADLEKERKLREARNAQKNAERATMRAHFRRKYRLSENSNDTNHRRSVGRKVSLPHELSKIIHPETKTKDNSFNLLQAFQGLNFGTATLKGRKYSKAITPSPANGHSCKVM